MLKIKKIQYVAEVHLSREKTLKRDLIYDPLYDIFPKVKEFYSMTFLIITKFTHNLTQFIL